MLGQFLSQFYPPTPPFTEKNCPDQYGKVFIVTGGYAGVGLELVKILFQKNATVYVAGRSLEKGMHVIEEIQTATKSSTGRLKFLLLDLSDLTTIKKSAQTFLFQEARLDILWNNAGVMKPAAGTKTKQGYELQLGTNCLGPFLFTQLLRPLLVKTAASSPPNSVRVTFTGSLVAEMNVPEGVINFEDINMEKGGSQTTKYGQSKAGNIFLGYEFDKRTELDHLVFVSLNPGNLKSDLQRHASALGKLFGQRILHPAVFGAYTELFAGLSPDVTSELSGSYIIPWGRIAKLNKNLADGLKSKSDGGTGAAQKFYDWCEVETKPYM